MLTQRFVQLYDNLVSAFITYDDSPRSADRVVELAAARARLDDVRAEIANERDQVMGLGRSRVRDEVWRTEQAIARSELFTMAHTSN